MGKDQLGVSEEEEEEEEEEAEEEYWSMGIASYSRVPGYLARSTFSTNSYLSTNSRNRGSKPDL